MQERAFSLLEEPWISVMRMDHHVTKVSLLQALLQAHEIRDLAGESKTQDCAIFRLLLAVVYTAFSRVDEQNQSNPIATVQEAVRRWGALWERKAFPEQPIQAYLNQWRERFWLFHPERPFYQVPGLQGTINPAKKLNGALVESSNKIQLFSLWSGETKNVLTFDEAARWLVFVQGFGDTAAKNPSPKLSWLGSIGLIMAKGKNLFESLMLNLVFWRDGTEPWGEGIPAWEAEIPQEKLRKIPLPNNPSELLTQQCRRILLLREENRVLSYVEAAGDYFPKDNAFSEQMTLWDAIKERNQCVGFSPKPHQPNRQMWRDFSTLMGRTVRRPGIISWLELMKARRKLDRNKIIALEIAGVQYGNMYCGIVDEFADQLQMYSGLLDDLGKKWQGKVSDEVERCDQLAQMIGRLAYKLDKAIGGDGKIAAENAKAQCYFRLDLPFRKWLLQIDPEMDLQTQNDLPKIWREQAKNIARTLGSELVEQGGVVAFTGREVKEKIKSKEEKCYYCAPKAFNQFLYELRRWEGEGK